jgi:predicted nucleic acid-binding protein
MTDYFLDTSALVKRYVQEVGTAWVVQATNQSSGYLHILRVTGPELVAALTRKMNGGEVALGDAQRASVNFRSDYRELYQIVELTPAVAEKAMDLVQRHRLRGYDSVQLAGAVELQHLRESVGMVPFVFVCADENLNQCARLEGLTVINPNSQIT